VVDLAILILAYIDSCVYSISELVVNGCVESPTRLATLLCVRTLLSFKTGVS